MKKIIDAEKLQADSLRRLDLLTNYPLVNKDNFVASLREKLAEAREENEMLRKHLADSERISKQRLVINFAQAQEKFEALKVLATNSGDDLVDACKQVKQVAISESDNSEKLEKKVRDLIAEIEGLTAEYE